MIKRLLIFAILIVGFSVKGIYGQEKLSDDQIKQLVQTQLEQKKSIGIAVGIIDENGKKVFGFGKLDKNENKKPDGNTLYEIGSITKVFTSILLQDMDDHGELNLNDPISKFLPKSVKSPTKNGTEITLLDLSVQISGLPRMPSNFTPKDFSNPFADYTPEKLYEYLSSYKLTRDIGERYEYSNVGVGLLGHILTLAAKKDYETLVKVRICKPLNMESTFVTITDEYKKRLATGYNESGNKVKNWDFSALAGAGALKSSVNDLLKFLEANLGLTESTINSAMEKTHKIRHNTTTPDLDIAMGWHVWKKFGKQILWHNGGTYGYRTFIGFDPELKKGVVVLSNSSVGVDDIGMYLLDTRYEIKQK